MLKLGYLKIAVSDIDRAVDFYTKYLDFDLEFKVTKYGWAQLKNGSLELALYIPKLAGGIRTLGESTDFHLSLDSHTFDKVSVEFLDKKMLSEGMIHKGNDGSTFIDLLDPDKNIIKIFRAE